MFVRLLLALTVIPFVELLILVKIAERFSWEATLVLILLTGLTGAWLARREGVKTLARINRDLSAGVMPTQSVVEGVLILAAGLVLITPGILTDLCGFALLVPPIRRWVQRKLAAYFKRRVVMVHYGGIDPFVDVESPGHHPTDEPRQENDVPVSRLPRE